MKTIKETLTKLRAFALFIIFSDCNSKFVYYKRWT